MSTYTGIETINVTLNLRDDDTFYNREKYFSNYLADVAERIRTGQSILDASAYPPGPSARSLTLDPASTSGTWVFAKGSTVIGAISYLKDSDQIKFTVSTDDTDINDSRGQIIDAVSGDIVTTFTISSGQFRWTEHISDEAMAELIAQIGSDTKRYYFSIIDDDTDERIVASGVAQYTRTMTFKDNLPTNFDQTISRDTNYPTASLGERVGLLEDLINKLNPDWHDALIAKNVSAVPTLDSYVATLLGNVSSDTRVALNTIFGANLSESLTALVKSHRKVLENMVIEVQAPTSNVFMYNVPLINDANTLAPTYKAYIDTGTIKFSTGAVSAAQFAFFYSTVAAAWFIQVLDGSTWKYVKSDGSIVAGTGPFNVSVDPSTVTGSARLSIGLVLAPVTANQWFYKITTAVGGPTTTGGNGRYEVRKLDLTQWMGRSVSTGLFTLGSHDDVILSTSTDPTARSIPIRFDSIMNPYTLPITKNQHIVIGSVAKTSDGSGVGVAITKNNAIIEGVTNVHVIIKGYIEGSVVPVGTYISLDNDQFTITNGKKITSPYAITLDPVTSQGDKIVQVRAYVRQPDKPAQEHL